MLPYCQMLAIALGYKDLLIDLANNLKMKPCQGTQPPNIRGSLAQ